MFAGLDGELVEARCTAQERVFEGCTHIHFLEIYETISDSVFTVLHEKHTSIFLKERIDITILRAVSTFGKFHSLWKDCFDICNTRGQD